LDARRNMNKNSKTENYKNDVKNRSETRSKNLNYKKNIR
jgi:hypothetical protein